MLAQDLQDERIAGVEFIPLASLFTPGAWFYTLIASLTQPIFDGFLLESQLKQAKGVQLQNLQAYRKSELSAFADVEKALIALQKFTLQEKPQNDVVASSRKAFDVAEAQLRGWHDQSHHLMVVDGSRAARASLIKQPISAIFQAGYRERHHAAGIFWRKRPADL